MAALWKDGVFTVVLASTAPANIKKRKKVNRADHPVYELLSLTPLFLSTLVDNGSV